jgi:hypothetical protein
LFCDSQKAKVLNDIKTSGTQIFLSILGHRTTGGLRGFKTQQHANKFIDSINHVLTHYNVKQFFDGIILNDDYINKDDTYSNSYTYLSNAITSSKISFFYVWSGGSGEATAGEVKIITQNSYFKKIICSNYNRHNYDIADPQYLIHYLAPHVSSENTYMSIKIDVNNTKKDDWVAQSTLDDTIQHYPGIAIFTKTDDEQFHDFMNGDFKGFIHAWVGPFVSPPRKNLK